VPISKYIRLMTKTLEQKRLKAYLESAKSAWTRGHLDAMVRGSSKKKAGK
jgi:hypothetical protein